MGSEKRSVSSHMTLEFLDKCWPYKKAGGMTNPSLSNHMNAFEYPRAYYNRHNMDNKDMPFAFASNQTMTSLLFAPHLYTFSISDRYHSGLNNSNINK